MPQFTGSIKGDHVALNNIRNLRNIRKSMGLTIKFVASRLGISSTALGNYELYPESCTPEAYAKIAALFNFAPFDPFGGVSENQSDNNSSQDTLPLPIVQDINDNQTQQDLPQGAFSALVDALERNTAANIKLLDGLRNVYRLLDDCLNAYIQKGGEA